MKFDVEIDKHEKYYRVVVTGNAGFERLLALVHVVGVESELWPVSRAVFDLRTMETPLEGAQPHELGVQFANSCQHLERTAIVLAPHQDTGACSSAARRNGLNARSFDSQADAVVWIRGWL